VRPGRTADHSPPSSAAVMEEYSYTSTHPLGHTRPVTGSLYLLRNSVPLEKLIFAQCVEQFLVSYGTRKTPTIHPCN